MWFLCFYLYRHNANDYELLDKSKLQCYKHYVNKNEQHLTIDSKVTRLGLEGCQKAHDVEGTSASCKQCVMSIFHLPPLHP